MPVVDVSTDEDAIRDLIATWLRASKAGDSETVLRLMAEDVVFLQPGQPPMRGRSGFAAAQKAMKDIDIDASSDIKEIRILGDWAWCWNRLTVVVTPRDGGAPVKREGDVLSVLQKQAGRWVIVRDANMLSRVES
jgi:uncharacterized protein (TIGR02246 family)